MKKYIRFFGIITLIAVITFSMFGCPNGDNGGDIDNNNTTDPRPNNPEPMSIKTAMQYFRDEGIKVGINIGNSLDSIQHWYPYTPQNTNTIETAVGNPKINQAYFNGLEQLGFNIIRIPVSYIEHIGPAPDYIVAEARLRRIAEVVNYARTAGLKAIINIHHDGNHSHGWDGWLNINKAVAGDTSVTDKYEAVWRQIAEFFINYGDYLMFQGFNEIHDGNWGSGTTQEYNII